MTLPQWFTKYANESFELGPRTFPGRIWTASGCFSYGLSAHDMKTDELASPYEGLGAVVTKTVTPDPRSGNPMPRLCELSSGAINSIGLENVGFRAFLAEVLPQLENKQVPNVVSLAASVPEEFGPMVKQLNSVAGQFQHWHGVELNLSCPNVSEGGHDFGRDPETVSECVAAARKELPDRALLVKLTPNVADISELAAAAGQGGADAVSAINTVVGLDVDLNTGQPALPRRFGGYSGPGILPIALAKVDEIINKTQVPVVGVGGIASAEDALKFFALGVQAVQVGTAQMRDPFCAAQLVRQLAAD
ncbi:MAG: dihydroorotate dehydrogenase [bacterium]|nr:dihydroorotate dehydrogenase [bacterium]